MIPKKFQSRRTFLRSMGVTLALPLLDSLNPFGVFGSPFSSKNASAESIRLRKKFIGVFFPNGCYTPRSEDGDFTWGDYLGKPGLLKDLHAAHKENLMVLRGVNTFGPDTHLFSVASFLTTHKVFRPGTLSEEKRITAPASLDQRILRQLGFSGPKTSLHVAHPIYAQTEDPGFPVPNPLYQNAISYGYNQDPKIGEFLPQNLFKKVFSSVPTTTPDQPNVIDFTHSKNKSILDSLLDQRTDVRRFAGKDDAMTIDRIFQTIREIEQELFGSAPPPPPSSSCSIPEAPNYQWSEADFLNPNGFPSVDAFKRPFQVMQKIIAQAMECDMTHVASIMYMPGFAASDRFRITGIEHNPHWASHHHNDNGPLRESTRAFAKIFIDLFHDLISEIKSKPGLIDETIAVFGTDQGDPNDHGQHNAGFIVAGAGGDLNLSPSGAVIGNKDLFQFRGDVLREIGRLYGLPYEHFGEHCAGELQGGIHGQPVPNPNKIFKNCGLLRG